MTIPEQIESIPFFFIIGRPRSGTTLLQTLFEAHPNVQITPESPVINECFNRFKHVKKWDGKRLALFTDALFDIVKFEGWKIDRDELFNQLSEYTGNLTFQTIIKITYLRYQSVFEKGEIEIFGDKNPRYSKYPEKLKEIFPDARFIHIVRDYRDHILSMQRVNLLNSNLPLISYVWRKSQKKIFQLAERYPDSILSVKYEDFVKNPEANLHAMCEFLGVKYDPDVLKYPEKEEAFKKEFKTKTSDVFHGNLFKPITADNVDKWKSKMAWKDILRADFYVGKYAELSGYSRQTPKRTFKGLVYSLPGYVYILLYNSLVFMIRLKHKGIRKAFR